MLGRLLSKGSQRQERWGDWQDTIRHWDIEESGIAWSRERGNVDRINLRLAT